MAHAATVNEMDYVEPPADPNEWTDEQWLEWLKATDEETSEPEEVFSKVMKHVVESTPGQVLGQAMLGLSQAIYGRHDDIVAIVAEGNGEPTNDEPFAVRLDPDHPERSSVVFKAKPDSSSA
jgi:hypothetical protein